MASTLNCAKLIRYVRPVYPREAKAKHVQGVVRLRILITKTGDICILQVVQGDSLLVPAALAAVRQWRYSPCKLYGEPVEIKTGTDVTFTLGR